MRVSLNADDTAFDLGGSDLSTITTELSNAANIFDNWCKMNRLTLNQSKCKTLLFHPNRRLKISDDRLNIKIQGYNIDRVQEFKYLGVILWCKLNKLTLNLTKSKLLCINAGSLAQCISNYQISIDGTLLDILDSKLNFENHIKMLKQKMFIRMTTLKKIR